MTLQYERTEFEKGARKVFHFVPQSNAAYAELVAKYGGDYVFRGNGASDNTVFTKILAQVTTAGNDIIRLYAGSAVFAAVVTVAKSVTIEGASDNPNAAVIDGDTSNVAVFSITANNVTLRNFSIDESNSGTVDTISNTGTGFVVDNVVIQGGNIASTTATITSTGNYTTVKNCKLYPIRKGINLGGSSSYADNNEVGGTDGTAGNFGIQLTGAAARVDQHVRKNTIMMTGSTNPIGVNVAANADIAEVSYNTIFATAANTMAVQADTYGVGNIILTAGVTVTTPVWVAGDAA